MSEKHKMIHNGSEWVSGVKAAPRKESDGPTLEEAANHAANQMSHAAQKEVDEKIAAQPAPYTPEKLAIDLDPDSDDENETDETPTPHKPSHSAPHKKTAHRKGK